MYIPNPVSEGHTETLQLTVIPQVLAWYIQYQQISTNCVSTSACDSRVNCIVWCDIIPPWLGRRAVRAVRRAVRAVRRAVRTVRRAEHSSRVQHSSRTVFIPTYIYRCDIIPPWLGKEHSIRVQHPSRTVFIPTYIYGCDIIPLWLGKEHSNCVRHANHSQALST